MGRSTVQGQWKEQKMSPQGCEKGNVLIPTCDIPPVCSTEDCMCMLTFDKRYLGPVTNPTRILYHTKHEIYISIHLQKVKKHGGNNKEVGHIETIKI